MQEQQSSSRHLVQRLWSCGKYLKDDGVASTDFLAQLAMLLFLKMAHERGTSDLSPSSVAQAWPFLLALPDSELLTGYKKVLDALGEQPGMVGSIFQGASQKIRRISTLRRLLQDMDAVHWVSLDGAFLADAYEEIVGNVAEESKSGAGQFFTPRSLIDAIVEVMAPAPGERISDPACGTGGFLIAARRYLLDNYSLSENQAHALQHTTFSGCEIVEDTARLCMMNLLLHGIGDESSPHSPIVIGDSLLSEPCDRSDVILANPPFGMQHGGGDALRHGRKDLPFKTGNKQLNFLQHIVSMLTECGRAAIVVPDNVLFGSGVAEKIRRWLLQACDVHTLLRLPTGIFSAQGIKTNVLFLQKRAEDSTPATKHLWVYDLRSEASYSFRQHPLNRTDLDDFVRSYSFQNRSLRVETLHFRCFHYEDLVQREKCDLDLSCKSEQSGAVELLDVQEREYTEHVPLVAEDAWSTSPAPGVGVLPQQGTGVLRQINVAPDLANRNDRDSNSTKKAVAQHCLEEFRKRFPKGTTIYTLGISNYPCLVKLYAISRLGSLVSLDFMLTRFMRGYRLEEKHIIEDDLPSKGILHINDLPSVSQMVQEIGERIWQEKDAYRHECLL